MPKQERKADRMFPDWLKPIADGLLLHLKDSRYKGKSSSKNPVTSTRILEYYNRQLFADYLKTVNRKKLTDAHIRMIVVYLLEQGHPIFSVSNGYYYGISMDEADTTLSFLKPRMDAVAHHMELVKKAASKNFQERLEYQQ